MPPKKLSGNEYRKRKLIRQQQADKHDKILKYFNSSKSVADDNQHFESTSSSSEEDNVSPENEVYDDIINEDILMSSQVNEISVPSTSNDSVAVVSENNLNYSDIGLWPQHLKQTEIQHIIVIGLNEEESNHNQNSQDTYPKDGNNRSFSNSLFYRQINNGEKFLRKWLLYSKSKNSVYCLFCKLFDQSAKSGLAKSGLSDWKNIHDSLKMHERSVSHLKYERNWIETRLRFNRNKTIDKDLQSLIAQEKHNWKNVLERLINITLFLAKNNLAFRGSCDKLFVPHNGNFLGLVELLGKFDLTLNEHLRRVVSQEIHIHYCGKTIQNELISTLGDMTRSHILDCARKSKYFSIILDCTPDISHIEQLSITLRFYDVQDMEIKEHFLTFKPVFDTTGKGLYDNIMENLKDFNLEVANCRGQGYDNGANMKGKNKGVQARILKENSRAFFMPCGCHSINLLIGDSVSSSIMCINFFGIIQRIYTLFAASVGRWSILKKHVKSLNPKPLSETRWECRIECIKAIMFEITEIRNALNELEDQVLDAAVVSEASSLAEKIEDFGFLVTLSVWYSLLSKLNIVSKSMQKPTFEMSNAIQLIRNCKTFLEEYRDSGFSDALESAKKLAILLNVNSQFKTVRTRRRTKQFTYECDDEVPDANDPEKHYKNHVFNVMLDQSLVSICERFEQMKDFEDSWGFLFNIKNNTNRNELLKNCKDLHIILTDEASSDIDGNELCEEIESLKQLVPDDANDPLKCLKFINDNNLKNTVPNLWVALRILVTIPVSVASGERSFSKLKLIKTYLRSTMTEDRLNNLAILSIENKVVANLNLESAIENFADMKARKKSFL